MPTYDFVCGVGHEQIDVRARYGERPACPECGGAVEILWKSSFPSIHGDAIDYIDHNMTAQPIRFTSKSERKLVMKQLGLREKVRHAPLPGTDKSSLTTMWTSVPLPEDQRLKGWHEHEARLKQGTA